MNPQRKRPNIRMAAPMTMARLQPILSPTAPRKMLVRSCPKNRTPVM